MLRETEGNPAYHVGDIVRVVDDIEILKVSGDGSKNRSYVKPMNEFCGKFATVTNVSRAIGSFEPSYCLLLKERMGQPLLGGFSSRTLCLWTRTMS